MSNKANSGKSSPTSTQSSIQSPPEQEQPAPSFRNINWRAPGNYDVTQASAEATIDNNDESLTIQAHAEDADINVLMRRYGITGKMPENPRIPTYGDFSEITDYRGALNAVRQANESFMEIPAEVRARFDNDPQLFLEFCSNPNNRGHLEQLGLTKPKPEAPPPPPNIRNPPSTNNPGVNQGPPAAAGTPVNQAGTT